MNLDRLKEEIKRSKVNMEEIAQCLSISMDELNRKIDGDDEFCANELNMLIELLNIQDPFNFFYSTGDETSTKI